MRYLIRTYENDKCVKAECQEYSNIIEAYNKYPYDEYKQTIKITKTDNGNRDRDD